MAAQTGDQTVKDDGSRCCRSPASYWVSPKPSIEVKGSPLSPHGNALGIGIWDFDSDVASDAVTVRSNEGEAKRIVDQHLMSSTSSEIAHRLEPVVG